MILAILQARLSSSRLPGKVLMDLHGRPMIERQLERLARSRHIDRLIVATSTDASDDRLAAALQATGTTVYRGPLADVLARFEGAAATHGPANHIVRLTADCPLADWRVVDDVIARHLASGADYTSNAATRRTFPKGLDAEVFTRETLSRANRDAALPDEREHVTLHVYRRPESFKLEAVTQAADHGSDRWTVDYPADLEMVRAVYAALYDENPDFAQPDVHRFLASNPGVAALNAGLS